MPSAQKRRIIEKTRKRQGRGRIYLAALVLIIIAIAVGWLVYSSSIPPSIPTTPTSPKADFTITAPPGVTIRPGTPTTSTITVTAVNQFGGTVNLTATGSAGLIATITPTSVTGSGTATLKTSATANGSYTVTVTGTSGNLTHTVTPLVATPVIASLSTSSGTIVVELYPAQAPKTVANFVSLAKSGFYTNLVWHRIQPGFVIQTGDPTTVSGGGNNNTWGQTGSPQTVPLEIDSSLHNYAGYLGMARGNDVNSGSSQFFINLVDSSSALDGKYTVFGRVITGMDVVSAIGSVPVYPAPPGGACCQPRPPLPLLTSITISKPP
jgi:cyclophilin family peptidyl-prolyl cis-trans isomerase